MVKELDSNIGVPLAPAPWLRRTVVLSAKEPRHFSLPNSLPLSFSLSLSHKHTIKHTAFPPFFNGTDCINFFGNPCFLQRSKSNRYLNTSLIQIEGVNTKEEVGWHAGKHMAYIYKAKVKKNGSHYRCIWGKVARPHGNSSIVHAKFTSNLPPKSMGARVWIFMYPSNI